jgi:hypothetical protein
MTIGKVELTENFARYRIRSPKDFVEGSFRTDDIGRKGHSKRIAGRLKGTNKWATQSILIDRSDFAKGTRVRNRMGRPVILHGGGWFGESDRHSMSRKYIKTGRRKRNY